MCSSDLGCTIAEETGLSREEFESLYAVMSETARRDGFRPHPSDVYWDMLTALGPEYARLFVLRRDGEPHCWDLVNMYVLQRSKSENIDRTKNSIEIEMAFPSQRKTEVLFKTGESIDVCDTSCIYQGDIILSERDIDILAGVTPIEEEGI